MVFNCMIIQINNIATLGVIVHFYLFILILESCYTIIYHLYFLDFVSG